VATVVRCAAASKPIRRAIAGPDFRHAIAHRAGFDPTLLLGCFSYLHRESCSDPRVAQQALRRNHLRFDAGLLETFEPLAALGGRRRPPPAAGGCVRAEIRGPERRVCNSLTGDTVVGSFEAARCLLCSKP
jgi:hypothetical protein